MEFFKKALRVLCMAVFGAVFIVSGFLKGIDPVGTSLKVKEYLDAFYLGFLDFISLPFAFVLSTAEFLIGVAVIKGMRIRFFSRLALGFISFFTLLTLAIWAFDPVSDCGCFGEALHLSNRATFLKNVVLLGAALVIFFQRSRFRRIAPARLEWIYVGCYALLFVGIQSYALRNVPQIDFGLYKPGTDLSALQQKDLEREYETTFIYAKDGKQETFTIDRLPDSTWTFVDSRTVLVSGSAADDASVHLDFIDAQGNPAAQGILQQSGPVFFATLYKSRTLQEKPVGRLMELARALYERNIPLQIVSAAPVEETETAFAPYAQLRGSLFDLYYADYKAVISFNRSSGGLAYVHDGTVVGKWPCRKYPLKNLDRILESDPEVITAKESIHEQLFAELSLVVIFCLIFIIRTVSGFFYKRYNARVQKQQTIDDEKKN